MSRRLSAQAQLALTPLSPKAEHLGTEARLGRGLLGRFRLLLVRESVPNAPK